MPFVVTKIDKQTLLRVVTADMADRLKHIIFLPRDWADYFNDESCAIDAQKDSIVLPVSMADRMDAAQAYLLITPQYFAFVKQSDIGTYLFVVTPSQSPIDIAEAKELVAEALKVGGKFLNGKTEPVGIFGVPEAKFI